MIWNRSLERDIGNVENCVLPEPTLSGYEFPDPCDDLYFRDIPAQLAQSGDCFRMYCIGFSLFERAWTLRGMENLMLDLIEHPDFVHQLLDRICEYNLERARQALTYDIDAIYYGDDWGQQRGSDHGPAAVGRVHPAAGRTHVCADQASRQVPGHPFLRRHRGADRRPDRLWVWTASIRFSRKCWTCSSLLPKYRGRVAFHGGLSTQQTLPHGTADDVRRETRRLLELGRAGGYIFAPAHAVAGDTPLENMLAFLEEIQRQTPT